MRNFLNITIFALLAGIAFAQVDAAQPQQAVAPVNIQPSGSPRTELPPQVVNNESSPAFEIGLSTSAAFDDNGGSFLSGDTAGFVTGISPLVRLKSGGQKHRLLLEYQPSFSRTTGLSERDDFGQNFNASLEWKLSKRWTMRLRNGFVITSNPFESALRPTAESPNATIATPFIRQKRELASAELEYFFSARTSVGAVGGFSMQRYNDPSGVKNKDRQLLDSSNGSGRAYFRHRFTKTIAGGFEYSYQDLLVAQSTSRTQSHTATAFTTWQLGKHSQISLFAGPERSRLRDVAEIDLGLFIIHYPLDELQTSVAAGATYAWEGKQNRFRAGYNRRVADGGGLIGAVRLDSVSAAFEQKLSRRWDAALDFTYGHNAALGVANRALESYAGGLTVRHTVSRDLNIAMSYNHVEQNGMSTIPNNNHNRVSVSLEYLWTHPLGR